ncbi:hypothetical protein BM1_10935 [Bipolaris maydis]|nr:hypothetical protein BM1_10935 [Bipolaris maydis]
MMGHDADNKSNNLYLENGTFVTAQPNDFYSVLFELDVCNTVAYATANESSFVPRNVKTPFANGSLPDIVPGFNDSAAFARNRNPLADEMIQPGLYKEIKPCEDMCFDIMRIFPNGT